MNWFGLLGRLGKRPQPRANPRLAHSRLKNLETRVVHHRRQRWLFDCVVHAANGQVECYPAEPMNHEVPSGNKLLRPIA
eukprot:7934609-Pyramimonas_sp.AAC.1